MPTSQPHECQCEMNDNRLLTFKIGCQTICYFPDNCIIILNVCVIEKQTFYFNTNKRTLIMFLLKQVIPLIC